MTLSSALTFRGGLELTLRPVLIKDSQLDSAPALTIAGTVQEYHCGAPLTLTMASLCSCLLVLVHIDSDFLQHKAFYGKPFTNYPLWRAVEYEQTPRSSV